MTRSQRGAGGVAAVLVTLLALADVVLVVMAVRHVRTSPDEPTTLPTAATAGRPTTAATGTPRPTERRSGSATPKPTSAGEGSTAGRERAVAVDASGAAFLATSGSCRDGGARLERSADGGATWEAAETPFDVVLRVRATGEDSGWVVGAATGCDRLGFATTTDGGDTWSASATTEGAWHLAAGRGSGTLHAPGGDVDEPCGDALPVELEGVTVDVAYVLCDDGVVQATTDAGRSWDEAADVAGARAIGSPDASTVLVATVAEDCDGLLVGPLEEPASGSCVQGAATRGVGLAVSGDLGVLVAGERTWTSDDAGASWSAQ